MDQIVSHILTTLFRWHALKNNLQVYEMVYFMIQNIWYLFLLLLVLTKISEFCEVGGRVGLKVVL